MASHEGSGMFRTATLRNSRDILISLERMFCVAKASDGSLLNLVPIQLTQNLPFVVSIRLLGYIEPEICNWAIWAWRYSRQAELCVP